MLRMFVCNSAMPTHQDIIIIDFSFVKLFIPCSDWCAGVTVFCDPSSLPVTASSFPCPVCLYIQMFFARNFQNHCVELFLNSVVHSSYTLAVEHLLNIQNIR